MTIAAVCVMPKNWNTGPSAGFAESCGTIFGNYALSLPAFTVPVLSPCGLIDRVCRAENKVSE